MEPELGMVKIGGPARQSGLCLRFGSVPAVWAVAPLGRKSVSGLGCDRGAARIRVNVAPARARISPSHWLRVTGLLVTIMVAGAGWNQTEARASRNGPPKRVIHGPNYRPPYAAIVVDDKSGFVLHEVSADEPRHPASLTKIMTLYLL